MKKLYLLFITIFFISNLQAQIKVTIIKPPYYQFNLASLWRVTLTDTSNQKNFDEVISLYGTATRTDQNNLLVLSATTNEFILMLNDGASRFVNVADIGVDVENRDQTFNFDYKNFLTRTGSFPAGEYKICVQVKIGDTLLPESSTGCYYVSVQNFSEVRLISPINESTVEEFHPIFTWLPPTPVLKGVNYTMSIYELLSNQTPYDAVISNRAFFEKENIPSTILRYPAVSRRFLDGTKYAVQVKAFIDTNFISESDISYFTYKDLTISEIDTSKKKNNGFGNGNDLLPNSASNSNLQKSNPVIYGVSSLLDFEFANRPGTFSDLDKNYGRFDVIPKIKYYEIPFNLNLFYPTNQDSKKQLMYNVSINLDQNSLKNTIDNKIEAGTKLPERLKVFSRFRTLGLGFNLYPRYTDYTVSGIALKGLNLEYNWNNFYFALAGPLNNKAIDSVSFRRFIITGRSGIGMINSSHLFFTLMYAKDVENSISSVINSVKVLTPKENIVLGAKGKMNLMKNKLRLEGEFGLSGLTDDTQAPEIDKKDVPFWARFFSPNISTRGAFFFKFGTNYEIEKSATQLKGDLIYVEPGYLSLGSPTRPSDKFEFQIAANQKLVRDQVTANASFKLGKDNLISGYKDFTTTNLLLNIRLDMRFKKYPPITLNYFPQFLSNDAPSNSSEYLDNVYHNLFVITNYPFKFTRINNNASLIFSLNSAHTDSTITDNYNWNLNLSDYMSFNNPLFISWSLGFSKTSISDFDTLTNLLSKMNYKTYILDLNAGYTFFDIWTNSLGFNITNSPGHNRSLLLYINSTTRILNLFDIDMRLERNIYDDRIDHSLDYRDIIFRSMVSMDLN